MNPIIRSALRDAGAKAGRQAPRNAGLPTQVEDHQAVQWMAELLIKAVISDDRYGQARDRTRGVRGGG